MSYYLLVIVVMNASFQLAVFQSAALPIDELHVTVLCMLFKIKSNPIHSLIVFITAYGTYLCRMCWRVLLVVIWQFIGTRLRILAVELLSTAGPLYPFQYRYETILMTLCLIMWDWRAFRVEPMPSCQPNLLFLFVIYYFLFFFLPRVGCVRLGSSDQRVLRLSPSLALQTHF